MDRGKYHDDPWIDDFVNIFMAAIHRSAELDKPKKREQFKQLLIMVLYRQLLPCTTLYEVQRKVDFVCNLFFGPEYECERELVEYVERALSLPVDEHIQRAFDERED